MNGGIKEIITLESNEMLVQSHIWCLSVDKKRQILYAGLHDGQIEAFDLEQHQNIFSLSGHKGIVYAMTINKEGSILYSGGMDQVIRIWDLKRRTESFQLRGHRNVVYSLRLDSLENYLISGSEEGVIRRWCLKTKCCVFTVDGFNPALSALVLKKDEIVISVDDAQRDIIKIFDFRTLKTTGQLHSGKGEVFSLAMSPEGLVLYSAGSDQSIHSWDLESLKEISKIKAHSKCINELELSSSGLHLYSCSDDCLIKIWKVENGHFGLLTAINHGCQVLTICLSLDDKMMFSAGKKSKPVKMWDVSSLERRVSEEPEKMKVKPKITENGGGLRTLVSKVSVVKTGERVGQKATKGSEERREMLDSDHVKAAENVHARKVGQIGEERQTLTQQSKTKSEKESVVRLPSKSRKALTKKEDYKQKSQENQKPLTSSGSDIPLSMKRSTKKKSRHQDDEICQIEVQESKDLSMNGSNLGLVRGQLRSAENHLKGDIVLKKSVCTGSNMGPASIFFSIEKSQVRNLRTAITRKGKKLTKVLGKEKTLCPVSSPNSSFPLSQNSNNQETDSQILRKMDSFARKIDQEIRVISREQEKSELKKTSLVEGSDKTEVRLGLGSQNVSQGGAGLETSLVYNSFQNEGMLLDPVKKIPVSMKNGTEGVLSKKNLIEMEECSEAGLCLNGVESRKFANQGNEQKRDSDKKITILSLGLEDPSKKLSSARSTNSKMDPCDSKLKTPAPVLEIRGFRLDPQEVKHHLASTKSRLNLNESEIHPPNPNVSMVEIEESVNPGQTSESFKKGVTQGEALVKRGNLRKSERERGPIMPEQVSTDKEGRVELTNSEIGKIVVEKIANVGAAQLEIERAARVLEIGGVCSLAVEKEVPRKTSEFEPSMLISQSSLSLSPELVNPRWVSDHAKLVRVEGVLVEETKTERIGLEISVERGVPSLEESRAQRLMVDQSVPRSGNSEMMVSKEVKDKTLDQLKSSRTTTQKVLKAGTVATLQKKEHRKRNAVTPLEWRRGSDLKKSKRIKKKRVVGKVCEEGEMKSRIQQQRKRLDSKCSKSMSESSAKMISKAAIKDKCMIGTGLEVQRSENVKRDLQSFPRPSKTKSVMKADPNAHRMERNPEIRLDEHGKIPNSAQLSGNSLLTSENPSQLRRSLNHSRISHPDLEKKTIGESVIVAERGRVSVSLNGPNRREVKSGMEREPVRVKETRPVKTVQSMVRGHPETVVSKVKTGTEIERHQMENGVKYKEQVKQSEEMKQAGQTVNVEFGLAETPQRRVIVAELHNRKLKRGQWRGVKNGVKALSKYDEQLAKYKDIKGEKDKVMWSLIDNESTFIVNEDGKIKARNGNKISIISDDERGEISRKHSKKEGTGGGLEGDLENEGDTVGNQIEEEEKEEIDRLEERGLAEEQETGFEELTSEELMPGQERKDRSRQPSMSGESSKFPSLERHQYHKTLESVGKQSNGLVSPHEEPSHTPKTNSLHKDKPQHITGKPENPHMFFESIKNEINRGQSTDRHYEESVELKPNEEHQATLKSFSEIRQGLLFLTQRMTQMETQSRIQYRVKWKLNRKLRFLHNRKRRLEERERKMKLKQIDENTEHLKERLEGEQALCEERERGVRLVREKEEAILRYKAEIEKWETRTVEMGLEHGRKMRMKAKCDPEFRQYLVKILLEVGDGAETKSTKRVKEGEEREVDLDQQERQSGVVDKSKSVLDSEHSNRDFIEFLKTENRELKTACSDLKTRNQKMRDLEKEQEYSTRLQEYEKARLEREKDQLAEKLKQVKAKYKRLKNKIKGVNTGLPGTEGEPVFQNHEVPVFLGKRGFQQMNLDKRQVTTFQEQISDPEMGSKENNRMAPILNPKNIFSIQKNNSTEKGSGQESIAGFGVGKRNTPEFPLEKGRVSTPQQRDIVSKIDIEREKRTPLKNRGQGVGLEECQIVRVRDEHLNGTDIKRRKGEERPGQGGNTAQSGQTSVSANRTRYMKSDVSNLDVKGAEVSPKKILGGTEKKERDSANGNGPSNAKKSRSERSEKRKKIFDQASGLAKAQENILEIINRGDSKQRVFSEKEGDENEITRRANDLERRRRDVKKSGFGNSRDLKPTIVSVIGGEVSLQTSKTLLQTPRRATPKSDSKIGKTTEENEKGLKSCPQRGQNRENKACERVGLGALREDERSGVRPDSMEREQNLKILEEGSRVGEKGRRSGQFKPKGLLPK